MFPIFMSCTHPIPALDLGFKINDKNIKVRNIKLLDMRFKHFGYGLEELKEKYGDSLILLPCGHCYSCACDYSRMWASRIMMEASQHVNNCFITLTYRDDCCPSKLDKSDFQKFMKKLRKSVGKVRFFATGELGETTERPHFHAIIFGFDFPDKVPFKKSGSGNIIYRSALLESIWDKGISSIGTVSVESAAYVAKYSLKKKLTGNNSGEFVLMSRRPGIGFNAYSEDIWNTDKVYLEGQIFKPPRYFEKIADANNSFLYQVAKDERLERAKSIKSEKYMYCLDREEYALQRQNDLRILNDARKVRL